MKTLIKASIYLIFLLCTNTFSYGQLVVNSGLTATQLVQNVLLGPGITAYNITSSAGGTTACIGEFTNGNTTNLGITAGVVMSTGLITNIPQAVSQFQSDATGTGSDPLLDAIAGNATYDAAIIEFDFVPLSYSVSFRYVFGSEEYPEYVGSSYNDAFGFFISGPNPAGGNYTNVNLAMIPGTTTPVTINNVNSGSNPGYFTDNETLGGTTIVYDGFTHVLTATCPVTPCVPYHIKLAVADAGDAAFDSGVFLEAGSFSGNNAFTTTVNLGNPGLSPNAIEDCSDATVVFTLNNPLGFDTIINFTVAGTATSGVDFSPLPASITIPAGSTTGSMIIHPLQDGLTEGNETVDLIVQTPPCGTETITMQIEDNPPFSVVTTPNTSVCDNDSLSLTSTVTGGLIPYTYQWSSGATTPGTTVYPTGIGTVQSYILTVTDACLATVSDTTLVTVNNCTPCATFAGTDANICSLSYTLAATTQPGDVNTIWSSTVPGVVFSNPSSPTSTVTVPSYGTYIFTWTVTNVTGLTCNATVRIVFYETPASTFTVQNPACFGDDAVVTYTGNASAAATYTWNYNGGIGTITGQGPHNVSYSGAGNYPISLSASENGCQSTTTNQSVNVPPLLVYNVITDTVDCNNGTIDNVTPNVSGGTPPYTFTWSNGPNPPVIAGNYQTTVTDFNGCQDTASFVITQPSAIVVVPNSTNLLCNGDGSGAASVNVSGGTPPYTYSWNPTGLTTPAITNLQAGTYAVNILDNNSCPVNQSITVTQPPLLTTAQVTLTDVNCYGGNNGSFTASASGGTNPVGFQIGTGLPQLSGSFNNLSAGSYVITARDANNCTSTLPFTISEPTQVTLSPPSSADITCFGLHNGSLTISGFGGTGSLSYSIGGTGQATGDFTGLYPMTYTVTATDANGCQAISTPVTITQPAQLVPGPVTTVNLTCYNICTGSLNLTASGGTSPYIYAYPGVSQPSGNFQNLCSGTFAITVTDAHGCQAIVNPTTITEPAQLVISSQNATSIPCNGNTATVSVIANGGTIPLNYSINNGVPVPNGIFTGLSGGTYSVVVTDNNGCSVTSNLFNIYEPPQLIIVDSLFQNITCFGAADGKIQAIATGGTSPLKYGIIPGIFQSNNYFLNLNTGNYTITVKDNNGCTDATTFTLTQPPLLTASASSTNARCYGETNGTGRVVYNGGTPPYQILWSNGNFTDSISNIGNGIYFVSVKDSNNCMANDTITITQPLRIYVTASNDTLICKNEQTTLRAHATGGTQPYTYIWNGLVMSGVNTPVLSEDSTFRITVIDVNGCTGDTARIKVYVYPDLHLTVFSDDTTVCTGSPVNLSFLTTGGSSNVYMLYDDDGLVNFPYQPAPVQTTTYAFRVYDYLCPEPATDSITIYTIPLPEGNFTAEPNNGCLPHTVNFNLTTDVPCDGFLWNFGEESAISYSQSPQHTYTTDGTFDVSVTITSDSGCTNTITRPEIVEVYPLPDSKFNYDPQVVSIVEPNLVFTNLSSGNVLNIWAFGDGDTSMIVHPAHTYNAIGTYEVTLTVISGHGCVDTSKVNIIVKDEVTVYAPSAFSPDNDGQNDEFYIYANGLNPATFQLLIYDRWGEVVYETKKFTVTESTTGGKSEAWNGSIKNGAKGTCDNYIWMMSFKDMTGKRYQRTGNVTLVR